MISGLEALAAGASAGAGISGLAWLERAHRLVPHDPNAALTLASACLARDPARAATLFQGIADKHDVRQAWLGLAAARLRLAGPDNAVEPLAVVLSRYAFMPDVMPLAQTIGRRPGCPGWCGVRPDGGLEIHPATPHQLNTGGAVRVLLDGKPVRGARLPAHWERGRTVEVRLGERPLLGSPIRVDAIRRLAGCVESHDGGIRGWAWHPGDPATLPVLTLRDGSRRPLRRWVAGDETAVADTGPLARPRGFRLSRGELPDKPGALHIVGPDGKDLPGSPLDPSADRMAHVAAALQLGQAHGAVPAARSHRMASAAVALRADAPLPGRAVGAEGRKRSVAIVIVVHDGGAAVLEGLDSVLAARPAGVRVVVVDDASSDPGLIAALDRLARRRRIALLRHATARGLPAAANAGIRAARGRDIVLLNGGRLVPPDWLPRLRGAAYASRDIGTVAPFSDAAGLLGYPGQAGGEGALDRAATIVLDRAARRANGGAIIDIPVGSSGCLYLRGDCLNAVGGFRPELFAQGDGEASDFCLRARRLGWRSVALTGLFVGAAPLDDDAAPLRARNSRILEQCHPGYQALISGFLAADPLAAARRRIELRRWRDSGRERRRSAILITHDDGGGVEQRLLHAIGLQQRAGRRAIVLRPAKTAGGEAAVMVRDGVADGVCNLIYAVPREMPALLRLLRATKPELIEAHHLAGYPAAIYDLVTNLRVQYDVHVHDYAWFCPRVSLVGSDNRYCGEPELPECEACVADNGHFLQEHISVEALRRRSAGFLAAARRVVAPSRDAGVRMRRHFGGLSTTIVPHEDDAAVGRAVASAVIMQSGERRARPGVVVVGGIGVHKGYEVLLGCARDSVRRDLDLEFIVVGHSIDDARLLATGRVFVTGRFATAEVSSLIAQQNGRFGFVPSICPETWCLSLGDLWRAGLSAAAFDIGAPAERIRLSGRGIVLPLGLPASAINNTLLAAIQSSAH